MVREIAHFRLSKAGIQQLSTQKSHADHPSIQTMHLGDFSPNVWTNPAIAPMKLYGHCIKLPSSPSSFPEIGMKNYVQNICCG